MALGLHAQDELSHDILAGLDVVDEAKQQVLVGLGIPDALLARLRHFGDCRQWRFGMEERAVFGCTRGVEDEKKEEG